MSTCFPSVDEAKDVCVLSGETCWLVQWERAETRMTGSMHFKIVVVSEPGDCYV